MVGLQTNSRLESTSLNKKLSPNIKSIHIDLWCKHPVVQHEPPERLPCSKAHNQPRLRIGPLPDKLSFIFTRP